MILFTIVFTLTQDQPKEFSSKTVIYTGLASGYSIESQSDSKIDFFGVNNAFDNLINIIKSRNTLEKVGLKLLTQHLMLEQYDNRYINKEHYENLMMDVPEEVLKLINPDSYEESYNNLVEYKNSSDNNFIINLLNLKHPHYSISKISRIRVRRVQNSDLIEINYNTDDAGICKYTLVYLIESFRNDYTGLKERQTDAVVRYFEKQLDISENDLDKAEDALLQFNKKNNIINYNEQTKFIASQKEDLELEYQRTLMTLKGAEAVLETLEEKLDAHSKLMLNSEKILKTRNELGDVNGKIALMELGQEEDTLQLNSKSRLLLKEKAARLREDLRDAVDSLYVYSSVKSGLSTRTVFDSWLKNAIIYDETKASLSVLDDRLEQFRQKYAMFAPLGASLKRIERKINVNEQEYLSLLHSLALAKLKQQNIELSSNLKVVDEPFYPMEPLPSKRKFLLAVSLLGGIFFVLFLILVVEYLDQNIKNHSGANLKIGLEVAGMYPIMLPGKQVDLDKVKKNATDHIIKHLNLKRLEKGQKRPHVVLFFSTRAEEGKSTLILELISGLAKYKLKSLYLNFNKKENFYSDEFDYYNYDSEYKCFTVNNCKELIINDKKLNWDTYDLVFFEIPSITHNLYSANLLGNIDSSYLVCRANRPWSISDANALITIQEIDGIKPEIIVNGVQIHEMESIVGDLPRKRSLFRKFLKDVLSLHFLSRKKI